VEIEQEEGCLGLQLLNVVEGVIWRRSCSCNHNLHEHASSVAVARESTDEVVTACLRQRDEVITRLVLQHGIQGVARGVIAQAHLLHIVFSRIIPKICNHITSQIHPGMNSLNKITVTKESISPDLLVFEALFICRYRRE
jgi:hypothetical protein